MGQQLLSYLTEAIGRIAAFLPNLLSAIVILAIGYLLSRVAGSVIRRLLGRAHFDQFAGRHLHADTTTTRRRSASGTVGSIVFWLGMLVTLSLASRSLNLETLTAGINRILAFVPRVAIAAIIVAVAFALGNVLADFVSDVSSRWLGKAVKVAVIALSIFMALDELGIAQNVVLTTYTAVLGAAAVAAAIAFGVGNIPTARDATRRWVSRGQFGAAGRSEEPVMPPRRPGAEPPGAPVSRH